MKRIVFLCSSILLSICLFGCSIKKVEDKDLIYASFDKDSDDVLEEISEDKLEDESALSDTNISDENDNIILGYKLDTSSNPSLQEKATDAEMEKLMIEGENSGISLSSDPLEYFVHMKRLSDLHPSDLTLKQKLNSNLKDYFKHYSPDIDKDYLAYVVEGSEEETNTYYKVTLRIEGFNSDGTDFIVKAIWPFGTPTDQFNFYSDFTPDGTYVLVDKDGNPIDWDSPIINPFSEE